MVIGLISISKDGGDKGLMKIMRKCCPYEDVYFY